jgi:hypothetical protein
VLDDVVNANVVMSWRISTTFHLRGDGGDFCFSSRGVMMDSSLTWKRLTTLTRHRFHLLQVSWVAVLI